MSLLHLDVSILYHQADAVRYHRRRYGGLLGKRGVLGSGSHRALPLRMLPQEGDVREIYYAGWAVMLEW